MTLTAARLRELLSYDPLTGIFTRLVSPCNRVRVGDVAGTTNGHGYLDVMIEGKSYRCHRLAWLYMTGEWPNSDIDHRDTKKSNNRWCNLREAGASNNQANVKRQSNNTSGFKGVYWDKKSKKFASKIRVLGRCIWLGYHHTANDAHAAYVAAAIEYFGSFARAA